MDKIIAFLIIFISQFAFAQENEDTENSADSLQVINDSGMLELALGHANHYALLQGDYLGNEPSLAVSLRAGFKTSSRSYFKSGIDLLSTVSFTGINYSTYRIPLLFGVEFNFKNTSPLQVTAFIDTGFYYRNTDVKKNQDLASTIENNSTYGFQSNVGFRIPVSTNLYAILLFNINIDFEDAFSVEEQSLQLTDTTLQIGLGYRF